MRHLLHQAKQVMYNNYFFGKIVSVVSPFYQDCHLYQIDLVDESVLKCDVSTNDSLPLL